MTVPAEIQLEATTDESLTNTGYAVVILDEDEGDRLMQACGTGLMCGASEWVTWAEDQDPQPHHYRVELRNSVDAVVASDDVVVDVEAAEWSVSLEAEEEAVTVPGEIELEATANRSTDGTGYSIVVLDEDDGDRAMNAACQQATCWVSEWVTWAENQDPEPHHYRVEVTHDSTGAVVASDQVVVDVLPVFFDASLSFAVVNGVDEATASATPSVTGTGYNVLIMRPNGTQVCQVWWASSCTGTVAVGGTYRAVVENDFGHVAGRSSWWTLTPSGPEEEKADDLDLIELAALYAGPSAVCSHVLLYPGTHLGGSSVSDQYLACEAAVLDGKNTLGVLRAIVAAGGGSAVLWYLHERITEETLTYDPSDDEEVEEPTPVPPPIVWPSTLQDDVDQLMTKNPQLTSTAVATTVIKTCQRAVLRAGLDTDECLKLPIFASGDLDVPEVTDHDRESIWVRPQWVLLNYERGTGKPGRGWQNGKPKCADRGDGQQCHEYPFFASKQGGPNVSPLPLPRLKLVPEDQNELQGGLYGAFAGKCLGYVDNAPFLSIPVPAGSGIPTQRLCNVQPAM